MGLNSLAEARADHLIATECVEKLASDEEGSTNFLILAPARDLENDIAYLKLSRTEIRLGVKTSGHRADIDVPRTRNVGAANNPRQFGVFLIRRLRTPTAANMVL